MCNRFIRIINKDLIKHTGVKFCALLGGSSIEDYSRVAPPNSFIHVKNFTSPKHLAKHLKYIANNDDAYNYYHQWRNEYTLEKVNVLGEYRLQVLFPRSKI